MRMIPIHSAKRQSSRTKLTHAGVVAAMVVLTVGLAALGSAASAVDFEKPPFSDAVHAVWPTT